MSGAASDRTGAAAAELAAFAAAILRLPWFATVGAGLTPALVAEAKAYVAALGLAPCPVAPVAGWPAAAAVAQRPDWSREWWQAESALERTLRRQGAARFGPEALLAALTDITEIAAGLRDRAAAALARAGIGDESLAKVAGGAAAQACHQRGLALLAAGDDGRAFEAKCRLFAAGRWPLGIVGGTCFVF